MRKVKKVLEKVYENKELRKTIVPLFIGDPGNGKSAIIHQFAKEKKVKIVELITSQMSPFEVSGIAIPDKDLKQMVYYNFDKLDSLKDGDILFFDEVLNGNPVVLTACLTVLEHRTMISGKKLPDVMIVAAANLQGMTPLTPQIKERFVWYNVKFDKQYWIEYMIKKYSITKSIGGKLSNLIAIEDFKGNNFNTPRSIDKAINMILHDVPTPYDKIRSVLEELVVNELDEEVKLSDSKTLLPKEAIKWIDLIKYKRGLL